MKKLITITSLVILLPFSAKAQVTTSSTVNPTTVRTVMPMNIVYTPDMRRGFEASLSGAAHIDNMSAARPTVALTWSALPGATYKVLRYSTPASTPAVLSPADAGTQFVAELLPGNDFYFRVVASGGEMVADTSAPYHIVVPAVVNPPKFSLTCSIDRPARLIVSWSDIATVDDYSVTVTPKVGTVAQAGLDRSSSSNSYTAPYLASGSWVVEVTANYAMRDYPVPGQTTRASAQRGAAEVTSPVLATRACSLHP